MRNDFSLGRLGLFLFCLFPLLPSLRYQSMLAMLLILLQLLSVVLKGKQDYSAGYGLPLLLTLPTLLLIFSLMYSEDLQRGAKYLERCVLMVVLPWLFFLNRSEIDGRLQRQILVFFALVMAVISWYGMVSILATGKLLQVLEYSNSYYFIREFLIAKTHLHPTYFSILLAIPTFGLQQELRTGDWPLWPKLMLLFLLGSLLMALFLASSKMILLATLAGSMVIWANGRNKRSLFKRVPVVLASLVLLVYFLDPLKDRAVDLINALNAKEIDQYNPDSMRKAIYQSTLCAVEAHFWSGVGVGDVHATLMDRYRQFGFDGALAKGYNTHNQYLHMWLAAGFFACLIFCLVQFVMIGIGLVCRNHTHVAIALLFALSFLSENVLSRQVGIFGYAFFSALMIFASWSKARELIYINGRFLSQNGSGVQRYAMEVARHLLQQSHHVRLIGPKSEQKEALTYRSLPLFSGLLWEQISLPIYLWLKGSPSLLNLGNSAPIIYRNNYLCVHDLAFMKNAQWFTRRFVWWYAIMIPRVLRRARLVFTVSAFSKQEILNYFQLKSEKVQVAYNGVPSFTRSIQTTAPMYLKPYALCVGSFSPRKNQKTVVHAFLEYERDIPMDLILVGAQMSSLFGPQPEITAQIEQAPNIIWYRQADDSILQNLYQNAICTIYLPHYEGFGLPVLESIAYRKPAVVSDIPVFRELFEGQVLFCPPEDKSQLKFLLNAVYRESEDHKIDFWKEEDLNSRFSYYRTADFLLKQISK